MTQKNQIYKCEICGNIVEVLHAGAGELVCCGQPMNLMEEKTKDEGKEKHVPVIEKISDCDCECGCDNDVLIKVGSIPHPMEEKHYIEWIEVVTDDNKKERKFLNPNDKPEAEFCVSGKIVEARIYCNVHGLWVAREQ